VKSGVLRLIGRLGVTAALVVPSFAVVVGVGALGHTSGLPTIAADLDANAQTGFSIQFAAPPIASAGSIAPGGSENFTLTSRLNGLADPNVNVNVEATNGVNGDITLVPSAQCFGQTQLQRNHYITCTTDSTGSLVLTYKTPANLLQFGEADWQAQANGSPLAITHYVYCDVFRFSPSPVATPGTLTAGATVPITLTSDGGLDQGITNSNVYVSFTSTASGGGTAFIGTTQLTSSSQLFSTATGSSLQITYTAPAVLPTSGADTITVRDAGFSVGAGNSDTYSFAPATTTPTISVGNSGVFEADQEPGIPMNFTVTVSPVQTTPITVSYTALCGIGDKECGEDFRQITSPKTLTIAAGAKTAILRIGQYSYVGGKQDPDAGGETYNEGLFVVISHPTAGVLGRSVGEGTLLPDIENGLTNVPDLYVGNAGIVPVGDGIKRAVDFTVTLGALESSTVTFSYATADGSAVQGVNYAAHSGTGTIAAGKDSAVITVLLYGNAPPPSPLTFTITISNASDASGPVTIGTATGTGTVMTS